MKKFLPVLVLLLVTAAAVAFVYKDKLFVNLQGETAEDGAGRHSRWAAGGDRPVSVLAETVKKADVPVYHHGVGTVQAYNAATVRAQVGGKLAQIGSRLVESTTRKIAASFFEKFGEIVGKKEP